MDLLTAPAAYDMGSGFRDPVADSQAVFRSTMAAMARPGDVTEFVLNLEPPPPLDPAMAAIALSLLDFETCFWLPEEAGDARSWLRFHTGARVASNPGDADFVLVPRGGVCPPLDALHLGSDEEPHRSATVILGIEDFDRGAVLRLTGAGIRDETQLAIAGLAPAVLAARHALGDLFPRGVDLIFTAGNRVAAIPRTTRMER